ncbi:DivIVA domain-containing protein [bacterium]|nr:DivIVA domain-containing protein [bacterium]
MSLSPLDISHHEFNRKLRGYDRSEVRAFLQSVANEVGQLQTQFDSLRVKMHALETQLDSYRQIERSLRDAVVTAQEGIRTTREQIEIERETVLKEAQLKAEQIMFEAERSVAKLGEELRSLAIQKETFLTRLRYLHQSQGELIAMLEAEMKDSHERPASQD